MSEHESQGAKGSPKSSRAWIRRIGYALRGVTGAVARESNFWVYAAVSALVAALAAWLDVSAERWCLLVLCMTTVVVAEMFNTSIEHLARAITRELHPEIRDALDVASGAVVLASIGAALVGLVVLGPPLLAKL